MYKIIVGIPLAALLASTFGVARGMAGGMADISAQVGLASVAPSEGDMPVFPYRGSLAIVPSRHGLAWRGMVRQGHGPGASFRQAFTVLPAKQDGHGCVAADFTNPSLTGRDGLVDLFCTKGACHGTCHRPYDKELWVQLPAGGFVDLARAAGITHPHARGRDAAALTLGDGRVVLAMANERSTAYPAESVDRAYVVVRGRFSELPLYNAAGTGPGNTASTCVVAVPRGANLPDLLFCHEDGVHAYRHDGGKYRLSTAYGTFRARDLLVADVDGNDRPDLLAVTKNVLQLRRDDGTVKTLAKLGDGHGLARGDMDCDGKPDILVVQSKGAGNRHILLQNTGDGLIYRPLPFPHPSTGSGDQATYIADWNGIGEPAMLVTHGRQMQGPTMFVAAGCKP